MEVFALIWFALSGGIITYLIIRLSDVKKRAVIHIHEYKVSYDHKHLYELLMQGDKVIVFMGDSDFVTMAQKVQYMFENRFYISGFGDTDILTNIEEDRFCAYCLLNKVRFLDYTEEYNKKVEE